MMVTELNAYTYVVEQADDGSYWAYIPDLPGCVTNAERLDDVEANLADAVELHLSYLAERGEPAPAPRTRVGTLER